MIAVDEDALICDFAQYYHVFDYEQLPVQKAAVLACGLPAESRIIRILGKQPHSLEKQILAGIYDRIGILIYMRTKDARTGKNRPESLLEELLGKGKKEKPKRFQTAAEFEAERKKILRKKGKK